MKHILVSQLEGTELQKQIMEGTVKKIESLVLLSDGSEKRRNVFIKPYKYWKFFIRGMKDRNINVKARYGDMNAIARLIITDKDDNVYLIYN